MNRQFDCIVAGAGTAGVIAALQCGRIGLKTLLLERSGQPGGTMTSSLIAYPGLFFAWKKQIISGLGWEMVTKCAELSGTELPRFDEQEGMKRHHLYQIRLSSGLYAALCDEELSLAYVNRLYHAIPVKIERCGETWQVTVATQDGETVFETSELIDCSGDASVTVLAGFARIFPNPVQPATFSYRLSGYDPAALDLEAIGRSADDAVRCGKLKYSDLSWSDACFKPQLLRAFGNNANHIYLECAATAEARSLAEQEGRASVLRAFRFLKRQRGMEKIQLDFVSPECGLRESAVIEGEYTVTEEEYCSGTVYPDSIAYTIYPIDLHVKNDRGVDPVALRDGIVPTIPLRAMLPKGSSHLLAAGRCISSDRRANSALRVQASCMAMGQAAGAAAALAVKCHTTPGNVNIGDLKRLLAEFGAIVP